MVLKHIFCQKAADLSLQHSYISGNLLVFISLVRERPLPNPAVQLIFRHLSLANFLLAIIGEPLVVISLAFGKIFLFLFFLREAGQESPLEDSIKMLCLPLGCGGGCRGQECELWRTVIVMI